MTAHTTRWLLAGAAFAVAMGLQMPKSYAFGDAPWCAVIELGQGDAYWDCQYRTVEECVPHVLAGDRGFCNPNPWPGPAKPVSVRHAKRRIRHVEHQ